MEPAQKGYARLKSQPGQKERQSSTSAWALVVGVGGVFVIGIISISLLLALVPSNPAFTPKAQRAYENYLIPMKQTLGNSSMVPVITFVEDFQCPACMSFHFYAEPHLRNLVAQYPTLRLQWVFVSYIDTFWGLANTESLLLAEGYHCANDLGFGDQYKNWIFQFQLDTYPDSESGSSSDSADPDSIARNQASLAAFPRTTLRRCPAPVGGNGTMTCKSPDQPSPYRCAGKRAPPAARPAVEENSQFWNLTTIGRVINAVGPAKREFFDRCMLDGTHRVRVLRDTQTAMATQGILMSGIPFVTVNAASFCDDPGQLADIMEFATDTIDNWADYTGALFSCPFDPFEICNH